MDSYIAGLWPEKIFWPEYLDFRILYRNSITKSQENQNVGERRLSFDRMGAAMLRIAEESFLLFGKVPCPIDNGRKKKL